ncbi:MAG: dockerin type I repeat-containing protein [Clostridia bacterium]|nr:dockerin type I repeat-containing protein [Clostridia bacterium]
MKKKLLSILLCITFVFPFAVMGVSACEKEKGIIIVETDRDFEDSDEPCVFFGVEVLGVEKVKAIPEYSWYKFKVAVPEGQEMDYVLKFDAQRILSYKSSVRCADPESHDEYLIPRDLCITTYADPGVRGGETDCEIFGVKVELVESVRLPVEGYFDDYNIYVKVTEGKEWEILDQLMLHPMVVHVSRNFWIPGPEKILLGDVDCEDDVDATDYALAKRHCLKTFELSEEATERGDVNQDGVFDAKDYGRIKRIALGTMVPHIIWR